MCLYLDQKTQKWNFILDAKTQETLRQSKVFLLRNTFEDEHNLRFVDLQEGEVANPCTGSGQGHVCHLPAMKNQFPWLKKTSSCYVDKRLHLLGVMMDFLERFLD